VSTVPLLIHRLYAIKYFAQSILKVKIKVNSNSFVLLERSDKEGTCMKYENPMSNGSKVIGKVKVLCHRQINRQTEQTTKQTGQKLYAL